MNSKNTQFIVRVKIVAVLQPQGSLKCDKALEFARGHLISKRNFDISLSGFLPKHLKCRIEKNIVILLGLYRSRTLKSRGSYGNSAHFLQRSQQIST